MGPRLGDARCKVMQGWEFIYVVVQGLLTLLDFLGIDRSGSWSLWLLKSIYVCEALQYCGDEEEEEEEGKEGKGYLHGNYM